MSTPSQSALAAAIALDPTSANAYLHPEDYSHTVDGNPSEWAQQCKEEIYKVAGKLDLAFAAERALARDSVVALLREFNMVKGFALLGPDTQLRFNLIAEQARKAVNAPSEPDHD